MIRHQSPRWNRFYSNRLGLTALGVALLAAAGGTAIALSSGTDASSAAGSSAIRQDDRANRDLQRSLVPTTPAPSATATPTAKPTTKVTPKTTTRATVKPKPAPRIAIPTSCSAYKGNQAVACALLPSFGFGINQMPALIKMWNHESGWSTSAANPSGAYGIPQALPGSKMATAGSDWRTSAATQIKWGLGYIKGRYGSPINAWSYWQAHGWY